jgi:hypothetical protein
MPPKSKPSTPIEAYKAIIDELANETTRGMPEHFLIEGGIYTKAVGFDAENSFVRELTREQRAILAKMLKHERESAIHDVLAELTWWLICGEVGLTFRGKPMPYELSGMGLHGDFVGRRNNWKWPEDHAG